MSDLPRILLCSFDVVPGPTGSSRRLTEYMKGLSDRFQVVGLTVKTPDHSHIERYHGARLLRVPVGSGDLSSRLMAFDRAVRRQLESEEYSLAHFTDPFSGYAPCEHRADYGFRVIYEANAFPSQELRYTHPQTEGDRRFLAKVRRQELFCLMNSDLVIAGSEVTRQFIQGLGVPAETLRVLRAPVDLASYAPELMGKPDGSPMRVIYLGSQVGYQGLPTLLRAMQHASRQVDLRLAVVGPKHGDWQALLEDLVGELKLAGKVEFQPPVSHDDLFKVMATADVGVVPLDDVDRNRAQGAALAKASEYLAAGRPIVAADLPVTRELLPESSTLFYPPGDWKELGERLIQLSNNPKQRVELGAKAREEAAQLVDASAIRGKLIDFYDQILGRPSSVVPQDTSESETNVGTPTSLVKRDEDSRDGRIPKTDPAIVRPFEAESTDPTAAQPLGPASSELPVVVGQQIIDAPVRQSATEPDARAGADLPVVMGLPLRDPSLEVTPLPGPAPLPQSSSAPVELPPLPAPPPRPAAPTAAEAPGPAPVPSDSPEAPETAPAAASPETLASARSFRPLPSQAPVAPPDAPEAGAQLASVAALAAAEARTPASPTASFAVVAGPGALAAAEARTPAPTAVVAGPGALAAAETRAPAPTALVAGPGALAAAEARAPASSAVAAGPGALAAAETRAPAPTAVVAGPGALAAAEVRTPPVRPDTSSRNVAPRPSPPPALPPAPDAPARPLPDPAAASGLAPVSPAATLSDEPEEISNDEIMEADDAENADDLIEPGGPGSTLDEEGPASIIDPWYAQLVHGYCPPEGSQFARHPPPTNFPGRDEGPASPRPKQ